MKYFIEQQTISIRYSQGPGAKSVITRNLVEVSEMPKVGTQECPQVYISGIEISPETIAHNRAIGYGVRGFVPSPDGCQVNQDSAKLLVPVAVHQGMVVMVAKYKIQCREQ